MKNVILVICFFFTCAEGAYGCDNGFIVDFVSGKGSTKIEHIVSADKLTKGASLFFYLTNDSDGRPDVIASFAAPSCESKNVYTFDTYTYDGSVAEIQSVFFGKGDYKESFFVIVSWNHNLDGVNTVGKYYAVFSYDYKIDAISKNVKLTNLPGEGPDGLMEGKAVRYRFKTAGDVRAFLNNQK